MRLIFELPVNGQAALVRCHPPASSCSGPPAHLRERAHRPIRSVAPRRRVRSSSDVVPPAGYGRKAPGGPGAELEERSKPERERPA
jgi:hypothetical protein